MENRIRSGVGSSGTTRLLPVIMAIAIFMQMLDTTILNTALPSIAADLNQSQLKIQSILVSYTLVLAICAPISGVVADKIGTKRTFLLAVIFFTLGSLFAAMSMTLTQLTFRAFYKEWVVQC